MADEVQWREPVKLPTVMPKERKAQVKLHSGSNPRSKPKGGSNRPKASKPCQSREEVERWLDTGRWRDGVALAVVPTVDVAMTLYSYGRRNGMSLVARNKGMFDGNRVFVVVQLR